MRRRAAPPQLESSVASYRRDATPIRAVTVHSLLSWRPGANPRYNRTNTLPTTSWWWTDVDAVDDGDELRARRDPPDARIIFVGDRISSNPSTPVPFSPISLTGSKRGCHHDRRRAGAGRRGGHPGRYARVRRRRRAPDPDAVVDDTDPDAVVDDTDPDAVVDDTDPDAVVDDTDLSRISAGVITLRRGHRNSPGIAALATAINDGDADRVADLVQSGLPGVALVDPTRRTQCSRRP